MVVRMMVATILYGIRMIRPNVCKVCAAIGMERVFMVWLLFEYHRNRV
jgi:hypothetical protein